MPKILPDNLKFIRINEGGYIEDANGYYYGYFLQKDLLEIVNAANKTLKFYKKNKVTDESIKIRSRELSDIEEIERQRKRLEERENPKLKNVKKTDLYLIHDTVNNTLKIGKSCNVKARIKQLQIATSNKLVLLTVLKGKGACEASFHDSYKEYRLSSEWFSYEQHIVDFFNNLLING